MVLDTVRKDYFDDYAPRLRRKADMDIQRCYTASNWTVPSHASLLTGTLPHEHGIHACTPIFSKIDDDDTFLSDLPEYETIAVNSNFTLNTKEGFRLLFDQYEAIPFTRFGFLDGGIDITSFTAQHEGGLSKYTDFVSEAIADGDILASVINGTTVKLYDICNWLPNVPRFADYGATEVITESKHALRNNDGSTFLYMNFMEAHMPHRSVAEYDQSLYSVPHSWSTYKVDNWELNTADNINVYTTYLRNLRQLYRASIDYLDRRIVKFIEWTQETLEGETTIIVTSDHGENLGFDYEDNVVGHAGGGLSEGLLHVPLLVFNPPDGFKIPEHRVPISQLDMGKICHSIATDEVADVTREQVPAERICLSGRHSLSDRLERFKYWDRAERCLYLGDRKLVWDSLGRQREYSVGSDSSRETLLDASATFDLSNEPFATRIEEYKNWIDERCGTDILRGEETVNAAVEERLKNLGYG